MKYLLLALMVGLAVQIDCAKQCGWGYDIASCRQACECRNLLQQALVALEKK